jgi:sporadic carbohydrate cluster protein (TIGR04323 family)
MKNDIYKGYIASRNIHELQIPQRIQNLIIRLYAEKKGKIFILSATEYIMENCFMMLDALVADAKQYEAIVFYSMFMLPANTAKRQQIYKSLLDLGTEIHFAFEEFSIRTPSDIQIIEDILLAKNLSQQSKESLWPYKNL